jgi:tRNA A37 threonylcarbamoyladenosine modification protein TsaB
VSSLALRACAGVRTRQDRGLVAQEGEGSRVVLALLDARKGKVYAGLYALRGGGVPVELRGEADLPPEELLATWLDAGTTGDPASAGDVVAVGEGAVVHAALLTAHGVRVAEDASESPVAYAGALLAATQGAAPETLVFRYLRDADSVVTVKAR